MISKLMATASGRLWRSISRLGLPMFEIVGLGALEDVQQHGSKM